MTTPEELGNPEQPLFPPGYLLLIAAAGFLFALGVLMTQPEFGVQGWGGLGIGVLSLIAWGLMAPDQLIDILRGRALQYGGTAILVTAVFMVALTMIYVVVREQGWQQDLSNRQFFSLTEEARDIITTLASDPSLPPVELVGFFTSAQTGRQDQAAILLNDIQTTSDGRITYSFVNPERNPQLAEQFGTQPGQLVAVPLDAEGNRDLENAELIQVMDQQPIIDALIKVTSSGNFRMLVLNVENGMNIDDSTGAGMSILAQRMRDRYNWTIEQVSLLQLNQEGGVQLNDPSLDGEVLVIPGGSQPLPEDALSILTDYMDNGGDVVIYAGLNISGESTLAAAPDLSDYLMESFGLRVTDQLILDPSRQTVQSPLDLLLTNFSDHPIMDAYDPEVNGLIFYFPHVIELAETAPETVTVSTLVSTEDTAYARDDLDLTQELTQEDLQPAPDSPSGPFVVMAAAENTATGARLVVAGTDSLPQNFYQQFSALGVSNLSVTQDSLLWAVNYDAFQTFSDTALSRNQPIPVFAEPGDLNTINFVASVLLPFGVLLLGVAVWWSNRERAQD